MNKSKVQNRADNSEINNFTVSTKLHPRVIAGINGTPAGVYALSESLKRGNAYVEAQKRINDVCLPKKAEKSNAFIVKNVAIVCLLLGVSFASMAQSKPSPKTNIMVVSQGRKISLTVADTTYLNNTTSSVWQTIKNYRAGGVIKNNDAADLIFALLNNRK